MLHFAWSTRFQHLLGHGCENMTLQKQKHTKLNIPVLHFACSTCLNAYNMGVEIWSSKYTDKLRKNIKHTHVEHRKHNQFCQKIVNLNPKHHSTFQIPFNFLDFKAWLRLYLITSWCEPYNFYSVFSIGSFHRFLLWWFIWTPRKQIFFIFNGINNCRGNWHVWS